MTDGGILKLIFSVAIFGGMTAFFLIVFVLSMIKKYKRRKMQREISGSEKMSEA